MKKLRIFDFDDTLALTDTPVRVMRGDEVVRNISSHEFKTYKLKDGERFDTGAFDKVLHPKVIKPTMMTIRKVLGKPSPAVVLTGRSKASPVKEWLASIGVDVEVYAIGGAAKGSTSGIAREKRKWVADAIRKDGWDYIEVFEDSKENLAAIETLKSEFPDVKFVLRYVGHYGENMKESRNTLRFGSWLMEADADAQSVLASLNYRPVKKKRIMYQFYDLQSGSVDQMPKLSYGVNPQDNVKVVTVLPDGKETQNVAAKDDIIMCGPSKEKYVVKAAKFPKLYEGKIGGKVYPEQGDRMVARYTGKDTITFRASWGEDMVLKQGDYVVREASGYYRIAKAEFEKTYNPVPK